MTRGSRGGRQSGSADGAVSHGHSLEVPLIGRSEELDFAVDALRTDANVGVVLAGAAGVGKTRLAQEVLHRIVDSGAAGEWLVASEAAKALPFGALASMLPAMPQGSPTDAALLMGRVEQSLIEQRGEGTLVLAIDDAHLLDAASAALVHQLASRGVVHVLLTVRNEGHAPDAITRLWLDGLCIRLEVQPLARAEIDDLVARLLGGDVERRTLDRLWQLTDGNVLFLRELALDALVTGDLRTEDGLWRWRGAVGTGPRLTQVIADRLGHVEGSARELILLLAIAEALGLRVLEDWFGPDAVADAETAGLIRVEVDGRRRPVRLAHPLYSEVIRGQTPASLRRGVTRRLADHLERLGARRRGDLLRIGVWYLESDEPGNTDVLTAAAGLARPFDNALSIRLGRAACDNGGGFPAELVLGWALADAYDGPGAEAVARRLLAHATTSGQRTSAALLLADVLLFLCARPEEAQAVLLDLDTTVDKIDRAELRAQRSLMLLNSGRFDEALALARWVLELTEAPSIALIAATSAYVAASITVGRTSDALAMLDRCEALARQHVDDVPMAADVLAYRSIALVVAGRVAEAEAAALDYRELAEQTANEPAHAWVLLILGRALLAQGRIDEARRALQEAVLAGREHRLADRLPWALALLAEAEAAAGNATEAEAAAQEAVAWPDIELRPYYVDVLRARAWVVALTGEQSRARALLLEAATTARARDQLGLEVMPLLDAVRLGALDECAARLVELSTTVHNALAPLAAAYANALSNHDAIGLEEVAADAEELGMRLLAAEALAAASRAHASQALPARAANSAARSGALVERCPGLGPHWPLSSGATTSLTRREREVAELAARGHSNRDIADRLVVSVRTVEGHLYHVYAKLGVTGRDELAATLGAPSRDLTENR